MESVDVRDVKRPYTSVQRTHLTVYFHINLACKQPIRGHYFNKMNDMCGNWYSFSLLCTALHKNKNMAKELWTTGLSIVCWCSIHTLIIICIYTWMVTRPKWNSRNICKAHIVLMRDISIHTGKNNIGVHCVCLLCASIANFLNRQIFQARLILSKSSFNLVCTVRITGSRHRKKNKTILYNDNGDGR